MSMNFFEEKKNAETKSGDKESTKLSMVNNVSIIKRDWSQRSNSPCVKVASTPFIVATDSIELVDDLKKLKK